MDQKECRICFESEEVYPNILFAPCHCTGSRNYIHVDCLQKCRQMSAQNFKCCDICLYEYVVEFSKWQQLLCWEWLPSVITALITFFIFVFLKWYCKCKEVLFALVIRRFFVVVPVVCCIFLGYSDVLHPIAISWALNKDFCAFLGFCFLCVLIERSASNTCRNLTCKMKSRVLNHHL